MDLKQYSVDGLMQLRSLLLKTYALIHDPIRHTTGADARNALGEEVTVQDGVQWCLLGAQEKAKHDLGLDWIIARHAERLSSRCANELYDLEPVWADPDINDDLPLAAAVNDYYGHEAALEILRCSVQKVRAELKRRQGEGS